MAHRVTRIIVFLLVTLMAVLALSREVIHPLQCNRLALRTRIRTERTVELTGHMAAAERARDDVQDMTRCIVCMPDNIDMYMTRAANLRVLGRNAEAASTYRLALLHDRRPELYMNLGETLLGMGQREEGLRMLEESARFLGTEGEIDYAMSDIPEREEVKARIRASR